MSRLAVVGVVAGSVGLAVAYVVYFRREAAKVAAALAGPCAALQKGGSAKTPAKKLALLLLEGLHPSPPPAAADLKALFEAAPAGRLDAKAFGAATAQDDDLWTSTFAGASSADLVQAFTTVTKGAGSGAIDRSQAISAAKAYSAMHVLASMLMSTTGLKDIQSLCARRTTHRAAAPLRHRATAPPRTSSLVAAARAMPTDCARCARRCSRLL
jgi:hypothetical protein